MKPGRSRRLWIQRGSSVHQPPSSQGRESLGTSAAPTRGRWWGRLAVVGVTAAAFFFVGGLLGGVGIPFARHEEPSLVEGTLAAAAAGDGILFVIPAMNAKVVSVVGSFSQWEPILLSDDDRDGVWTAVIPLLPGRYEYAFVVDGRWSEQDPSADEYVRSFDGYSSVRYVGGRADGA